MPILLNPGGFSYASARREPRLPKSLKHKKGEAGSKKLVLPGLEELEQNEDIAAMLEDLQVDQN